MAEDEQAQRKALELLLARCDVLEPHDEALLDTALQARALAESLRIKDAFAQSILTATRYYFSHHQYWKIIDSLEALLAMPFELGHDYRVQSLYALAQACLRLDETRRAVRYASEALSQLESSDNYRYERMKLYGFLGTGLTYFGAFHDALEHYKKQIQLAESLEIAEANGYTGLGWVHLKLENYTMALSHFQEALRISRQANDFQALTFALINLGKLYQNLGNYTLAKEHFLQALEACKADGYDHIRALIGVYSFLGRNYYLSDDVAQARAYYKQAQQHLPSLPSKVLEGWLLIHMGQTFLKEDAARAETMILEGMALIQAGDGSEGMIDGHHTLYHHYEAQGRFAEALEQHKIFSDLTIKWLKDVNEKRTQALSVQFEVERLKREQELYKLKNVELARMIKQLEELSTHDALTGLYNRRFLDEHLRTSFQEAMQNQQHLSIILSDIDHFKQVNDKFSHAVGDEVLRIIGKIFQDTIGTHDISARYGGEEFIVVCHHRNLEQTEFLAENIRRNIQIYPWHTLDPTLSVTGSFGICADMSLKNHEKMIALADIKLYEAKDMGRNQVRS